MTTPASLTPGSQGRLANVLALRGTRATPEAPFVIEHREALIYMLCLAAELEHSIMCQYLYAAFSLKQATDENLTPGQVKAIERWRKAVTHVATQEMLHLALVQNLLTSIGAAPHFGRPNLPPPPGHFPASVSLALMPFGEQALRHFMYLERPEGMQLDDAEGQRAMERATPAMRQGDIVPQLQDFATVGHLYRSIEEGIRSVAAKHGEARLFCGPRDAQAISVSFGWKELVAVGDLASAQAAIDTIIEQGEGARGDWRKAHFGQFVNILDECLEMRDRDPSFQPARPVLSANVRAHERDLSLPLISDVITARCADLFNVGYEVLLLVLQRYFGHLEETEAQLGVLVDVALNLMFEVIGPLAQLITRLPIGADFPGRTAGPSFELFYESDYVLPHRRAAWLVLEERLRDAHAFCERIQADAPRPFRRARADCGEPRQTGGRARRDLTTHSDRVARRGPGFTPMPAFEYRYRTPRSRTSSTSSAPCRRNHPTPKPRPNVPTPTAYQRRASTPIHGTSHPLPRLGPTLGRWANHVEEYRGWLRFTPPGFSRPVRGNRNPRN